ncbi:laminin subunit alpha isoform X2 [Hyposmocoma kahamanoa]|uniref:laminin subunit alpha isoform X2 n=1 Tax=Hyposmocoma kahamanoa TaxID=1477025 RepID=UPI000E6D9CAF|nr:laminin subunit alpha isoform X2 [Hyposmocoma kahamanoa]
MAQPVALLLLTLSVASAEILTPPYFNLAQGKKVTATATCGDEGPELYCKLVGANADHDEHVIQGQVCDFCDATNEAKKHPPEYAVDGMETWWQSPPLSRGMKYNEVNLTIDLGQEFHVAYVFVRMGNSPRPGLWALEKSSDYGKTFKPWMYFSDSPQDCERYFGKESLQPITRDDSVICSTEYSKIVPLEGGEIPISLLTYRPSANMYFNSSVLQEWTRATNVRLRLLRTKNLLGHLMSVARQDPTVTRRYFYSIKDISIGGRCMCNGHADVCMPAYPESNSNILVCHCQHNTRGPQCTECRTGFEQKKWRISQNWDRFSCEPCNCHNHTTKCVFDPEVDAKRLSLDIHGRYEGGGVCQDCQHNTEGINCNKCKPKYYRPYDKSWNEIDVCQPCNCDQHYSTGNCQEGTGRCECRKEFNPPNCDSCAYGYFDYPNCKPCTCNLNGTDGEHCTPIGGICPCKYNYAGTSCEICADGFYSPECKNCECNSIGSVSQVCDKESGNCTCKSKYAGRTCNQCEAGYYNYPSCKQCNCDVSGTAASVCDDVTGQCICKTGFGGARCDQCLSGYYMDVRDRERLCVPCNCSSTGSPSTSCSADGKCNCLVNFGGKQCDQCSPGYYEFPDCLPCNCDTSGSVGYTCDDNGRCHCRPNFDGDKCDRCKEQFYNYPACEECNCDPRGVVASFAGCGSVPAGQLCQCKVRVQGRICNDCKSLFWNLQEYNPLGCEECNCNLAGTLGGLGSCNTRNGQCTCKMHVSERQCDDCQDGFYKLQSSNVFGCTECDCDIGGSIDNNCDKTTGQCRCHSRVEGRRCDRPIRAHYFPTLHQFRYEVEEGLTPSGPVRYKNSEDAFPGFSWKGYVVFSILQNEVINVVHITKSSLYRIVLKYASKFSDPVVATFTITPESFVDDPQTIKTSLRRTVLPQLVTVTDESGVPAPLVMNPGNWTVTIKTAKEIMIDYFVLVPEAYYEATILTKLVDKPCVIGEETLCREFAYPSVDHFAKTDVTGLTTPVTKYIDDPQQLKELKVESTQIPILSDDQSELQYNIKIDPSGPYVLLVEYVSPVNRTAPEEDMESSNVTYAFTPKGSVTIQFKSGDNPSQIALVNLNDCPYPTPCRQVAVDDLSKAFAFAAQDPNNVITLEGEHDTLAGIKQIIAIPEADWHLDYITPRPYCLRRNGYCDPAVFSAAVDSKKVEIESGTGGDRETKPPPILDNSTMVVYLPPQSEPIQLESKVPVPGEYMIILHYYQPDNPESTIDANLTIDGQNFESSVSVEHCPSNSGCRALLKLKTDGNPRFNINENFTITFNGETSKGVWLDYVLVIATGDYVDTALKEANMLDYTREFIEKCSMNHYYIAPNATGLCRDAVFSITTEYNSGTLRCFCDVEGSTDLECETFGGQCRCRPNVIGRTCSACRTGYYGFPNCQPCNCPSTAICNDYGECICPKNVEGDNCDRCKPYTFNFDELRGCDDCNCNPLGVVENQLQCDHCVPGHYAFPDCVSCSCDLDGTTEDVCDQNTAQCYCKKNVRGLACDQCLEGYFDLQAENPEGCTKCYCFGKTTRCSSSYNSWVMINGMTDWKLVNIAKINRTLTTFLHPSALSKVNETVIGADLGDSHNSENISYFGAPDYYCGKRLSSYGGHLTFSIFYTTRDVKPIDAPDVIISTSNGYLVHSSIEQPPPEDNWTYSVKLSEDQFKNLDGSSISREQFMNGLQNVVAIYIRAAYDSNAVTTRLGGVTLDIAMNDNIEGSRQATSVEQCLCPSAYRGMSCEQCAEGYYRLSSGPHAGFCVPCQCNGHSRTCDVNTGVCLACTDNTMGDHCEQCIPGYHGDATIGTPRDCLICACPIPSASNNFATSCELSGNGTLISCVCKPGYGGQRCEYCAPGFYGEPENTGDYCKPCNCSGNINVDDPSSCDTVTGDCLKCVNNTAGDACNLCAPGFFGDAILSKNCTACVCDEFGMDWCDPTTGTCVCQEGVIGEKCDRCKPNHWGFFSGLGCKECNCSIAAVSTQCDEENGQCRCQPGVTGTHCERCAAGYYNYTEHGCIHCNCNTGYSLGFTCSESGQCECLPDVIGEKCDRCPERWVLIPNQGCERCDSCTDALIFTVEDLSRRLANETQDFKNKADSYFTTQRLNYIANQTELLRPKIKTMKYVDVAKVTEEITKLENNARNLLRSAEFAETHSDKQIGRAADLAAEADKTLAAVRERNQKAHEVVRHVVDLATGLELSQQPKVDSALAEAEQIKADISAKNLSAREEEAFEAFANATAQVERMNVFVQPIDEQAMRFERQLNATRKLKSKFDDMEQHIKGAREKTLNAERVNFNNKKSKFEEKVASVVNLNVAAMNDLIETANDTKKAADLTHEAGDILNNSSKALEENKKGTTELGEILAKFGMELPELQNLTDVAFDHAIDLRNRAESLRALAERENNNTNTQLAYAAASAYSSIVQEIGDAKRAADEAEAAIGKIVLKNDQLKIRTEPAYTKSNELLTLASQALVTAEEQLHPNLTAAELQLQNAMKLLNAANDTYNGAKVNITIPQIEVETFTDQAERTRNSLLNILDIMKQLGTEIENGKKTSVEGSTTAVQTNNTISNVQRSLKMAEDGKPNIDLKFRAVEMHQAEHERRRRDADEKLNKLKELIEQARTIANSIPVGGKFDKRSVLQPRLPDSIDEMSTSTHVSVYFRTPNENAMILYLGNPPGTNLRKTKTDDFMVIGIKNGYPYLTIDTGYTADDHIPFQTITSETYVSDNKTWYQAIVDRVGRNVKFSIRGTLMNNTEHTETKEVLLPGQTTIFNLDKKKSKLYVGGAPSGANLQGVNFPYYEGEIEELMIGETPVGLWNFETAENLNGTRQRNQLVPESTLEEYRFNGRAHVIMPAMNLGRWNLENPLRHKILLHFRTYAPDGLIYLVGQDKQFFSVLMQGGQVFLQVSLGDGSDLLILGTDKTYNDGKWHKLDAGRSENQSYLIIDNNRFEGTSTSSSYNIPVHTMNFGGNNKGITAVTSKGFDGCLREINVDTIRMVLDTDYIESIGVSYRCQFASLVSLSGVDTYLRFVNITSTASLQFTLKFKTAGRDGLIFVYEARKQTTATRDSISLKLSSGKLVLASQGERIDTGQNTYDDDQWHVVTVTHNKKMLRLAVDDFDSFSSDIAPKPLNILDGVLFIGGVEPGWKVTSRGVHQTPAFQGCIADATFNGQVLNLLDPYGNRSVTFGRCGTTTSTGGRSPDLETSSWTPPLVTDVIPLPTVTQIEPSNPLVPPVERQPATVAPISTSTAQLATSEKLEDTTTKRTPPQPEHGCALSYDDYYTTGHPDEGYRFGTRNDSHIAYAKLPGRQKDGFDLSISFRTFDEHGGLIFYAASNVKPSQFLAVYMKDGLIHFEFNCGGETGVVTSTQKYNTAEWHTVTVVRNAGHGKLSVDSDRIGETSVTCIDPVVLTPPYYYGGLRHSTDANNLHGFYQPFIGCLKGLMMNGQHVPEVVQSRVNALRCIDNIEDGVYFGPSTISHSNYLKLLEKIKIGNEFSIAMEVKPRNSTGLLLSAHGKKDYMILELMDNQVVAHVENGKGPFHAVFKLANKSSLCDGKWHKIQAIKLRHVVSVGVDGQFSDPGIGMSSSTDTGSALYIGGHERAIGKVRGVTSKRGFTGCIRNIVINTTRIKIPLNAAGRNTHVGVCPKD